ncbi:hypothetical protein TgHK011_008956 [Trichoderma gracile]|nr:hypothetical protein TgHK011_008956 [Trichoderma gracile]
MLVTASGLDHRSLAKCRRVSCSAQNAGLVASTVQLFQRHSAAAGLRSSAALQYLALSVRRGTGTSRLRRIAAPAPCADAFWQPQSRGWPGSRYLRCHAVEPATPRSLYNDITSPLQRIIQHLDRAS